MTMNPIWSLETEIIWTSESVIDVVFDELERIVHEFDFHLHLMIYPHMTILLTSGPECNRAKSAVEL